VSATLRFRAARTVFGSLSAVLGLTVVAVIAPRDTDAAPKQVACGDTITTDTTLHSDLSCPGDGIVIGADGITLDLNGHTLKSVCDADCEETTGIENSGGYDRVRIINGAIDYVFCYIPGQCGFGDTIALVGADRNTLAGLKVDESLSSRFLLSDSNGNRIKHSTISGGAPAVELSASDLNTISRTEIHGGVGPHSTDGLWILEGSDNNRVTQNSVTAEWAGVLVFDSSGNVFARNSVEAFVDAVQLGNAQRTLVSRNTLRSAQGLAIGTPWLFGVPTTSPASNKSVIRHNAANDGIFIRGDRNLVAKNDVRCCTFVPTPSIDVLGGDGNRIHGNTSARTQISGDYGDGDDGIRVEPAAIHTVIEGNSATGGADDGIDVDSQGTVIRANIANGNADLGIEAVAGAIDGGGNRASGNGDPRQCVNVKCR
jgi:parallel beta-helix repeat protein